MTLRKHNMQKSYYHLKHQYQTCPTLCHCFCCLAFGEIRVYKDIHRLSRSKQKWGICLWLLVVAWAQPETFYFASTLKAVWTVYCSCTIFGVSSNCQSLGLIVAKIAGRHCRTIWLLLSPKVKIYPRLVTPIVHSSNKNYEKTKPVEWSMTTTTMDMRAYGGKAVLCLK